MNNYKTEASVLTELYKGASMGKNAIHYISDKVQNEGLKKELSRQYKKYQAIADKVCDIYPQYSDEKIQEPNPMNKIMSWYGIELKTLMDESTTKIADLLLQGTNMGIIEGRKLLNHKGGDENVNKLLQEYVDMQEDAVEKLKEFL